MKNSKLIGNITNECVYYVEGMHCASCVVLIEKKIKSYKGVLDVDASLKSGKVGIQTEGNNTIDINDLNREFKPLGYKFATKQSKNANTKLMYTKNGKLLINKSRAKTLFISFFVALFIFSIILVINKFGFGNKLNISSTSSLFGFLILGLIAGTSTCAALVGGMLLSMSKKWNELNIDSNSTLLKAKPHILFHIGRFASFAIFGALLGLIGSFISLDNTIVFSILVILISIVMLILALQMLDVSWAYKIRIGLPKSFTNKVLSEDKLNGKFMPFMTGFVTFFTPCGFTLVAQTAALATGNPVKSALIMLAFALGTFPILAGISFSSIKLNKTPKMTSEFNKIAGFLIIFFVIMNLNAQFNVLGIPSLSNLTQANSEVIDVPANTNISTQTINITAKGFEYIPNGITTIQVGVPTKLEVDNQGIDGCGVYMAARGLFKGYKKLEAGKNTIEFTPAKTGTYKLTCSMGMVPPVSIIVI